MADKCPSCGCPMDAILKQTEIIKQKKAEEEQLRKEREKQEAIQKAKDEERRRLSEARQKEEERRRYGVFLFELVSEKGTNRKYYINKYGETIAVAETGYQTKEPLRLSVTNCTNFNAVYHPSKEIFTAAGTGGITIGGVTKTKAYYTSSSYQSGRGKLEEKMSE